MKVRIAILTLAFAVAAFATAAKHTDRLDAQFLGDVQVSSTNLTVGGTNIWNYATNYASVVSTQGLQWVNTIGGSVTTNRGLSVIPSGSMTNTFSYTGGPVRLEISQNSITTQTVSAAGCRAAMNKTNMIFTSYTDTDIPGAAVFVGIPDIDSDGGTGMCRVCGMVFLTHSVNGKDAYVGFDGTVGSMSITINSYRFDTNYTAASSSAITNALSFMPLDVDVGFTSVVTFDGYVNILVEDSFFFIVAAQVDGGPFNPLVAKAGSWAIYNYKDIGE